MAEAESINIEYHTLRRSHELVVSEIAEDPKQIAAVLFKHQFISRDTLERVNELNETKRDKASRLVCEIETEVNHNPTSFQQILTIFTETGLRYVDLVTALQNEYENIQATASTEFLQELLDVQPVLELSSEHENTSGIQANILNTGLPELPTADDRGTIPDPLENPPDSEEVGRDIRADNKSHQEIPNVTSLEGKLLQILQTGEHTEAIKLLSQAESQAVDLRDVCDSDGKTLLHLACQKNWEDWFYVVLSLIEKHNCDVSAVDEDGNTPLHDAYRCRNHKVVLYLLSLPTCKPDVFNKYDTTVLKMALEADDIPTTRELLATGRVDPRRGSPRGHTYEELLAADGLLPQDIDGSALQMVAMCAECIKKNKRFYPKYTFHYLLNILSNISIIVIIYPLPK